MKENLKLSPSGLKLVRCFADDPTRSWSGAELTKTIGIGSGTLYPLLAKLESAKWLSAKWETIDPSEAGRPRRRFYSLTPTGARGARNALADFQISPAIGGVAWTT